jgi:hypothetical protein
MAFFLKALHLLTLGLWLGGVTFFSFFAALPIIHKYESLAERSDNWLGLKDKRQGTRAAGEALEAVFVRYFPYQVACGAIALLTSLAWWSAPGMAGKARLIVIAIGLALAVTNLLVLAPQVSELRDQRYSSDSQTAARAEAAFGPAHTYSLVTDMVTLLCVGAAMALAAALPGAAKPE